MFTEAVTCIVVTWERRNPFQCYGEACTNCIPTSRTELPPDQTRDKKESLSSATQMKGLTHGLSVTNEVNVESLRAGDVDLHVISPVDSVSDHHLLRQVALVALGKL